MEATKKAKKKKAAGNSGDKVREAYIDYLLENGKRPSSVFKFCKGLGMKEDVFYAEYGSFEALEKSIWKGYAKSTIKALESDANYAAFNAREKVLAFYFTLMETLKRERSFVLVQLAEWKIPAVPPLFIKSFRKEFTQWAEQVINEGKQLGEIATRPYLDKQYTSVLWLHLQFILKFWGKDDSADFEKTDVAIEKSVNLAFDLLGKGVLDNALDFGKFLFQQSRD